MKKAVKITPLPLLWIFKYKYDTDSYLMKFKAHLCVRDNLQSTKQDTYAAILTAQMFQALMTIAAAFDLKIQQYNAVNTFVNAKLNEEIHCYPPESFKQQDNLWLLLQTLYGLKQSPLLWYTDFTNALKELRLHPIPSVNYLYVNESLLLFFYVNDIAVLFSKQNQSKFKHFKHNLLRQYEMRSLRELKWFLNIQIEQNHAERKIWLCQNFYISKMTAKFNISTTSKALKTPLPSENLPAWSNSKPEPTAQQILAFQQRIGSSNFAAVITRPDVAYAVSRLAQHLKKPTETLLTALNRVIAYLYGTHGLAIKFSGRNDSRIFNCSSNTAFADNLKTHKSSDGYLF